MFFVRYRIWWLVLTGVSLFGFWGEFVHCDVGSCPYPNPEGRFLSINSTSIVFDTSGDPSAMGFYVVAVELGRHSSLEISGWWSYQLPRTMAYVVSDAGLSVMECSTGGGQTCRASGVLSPGIYYIVLVDAWAQQTVRVAAADGSLKLADVSPQRVACALWRGGVLAGQRITYAFDWPSRPGASVSQDIAEGACGPPALQEALAFAAVFGLNASEASLLTRPFGYNVTAVERRYGTAVFRLQPDLTYVVPLVFDVQLGGQGRLLLVNPSGAAAAWRLEVHVSNKSGAGSPRGRPAASFDVVMPPRSVRDFFLYGSAREGGFYVVSYRLYVLNSSASWGNYTFYVGGRPATQNGSVLNFLWGLGERLAGALARDRCLEARGAGRQWAAERLGLTGLATEADAAVGGLMILSGGFTIYIKLGKSAAEAGSAALKIARGLQAAAKAAALADLLAHGALLGWDAYLDAASGRLPLEEIAQGAVLAAGPAAARIKPLAAALAGGGAVMLYLGKPLDAAPAFADELNRTASVYGPYADCFIDGALQAFSTYAQEVEAARWVGIASTFADIPKLLNNKYWLGHRQLAAAAAFDYEPPVPVFRNELSGGKKLVEGEYDVVIVRHRNIGVNPLGSFALQRFEWQRGKATFGSIQLDEISSSNVFYAKGRYYLKAHYWRGTDGRKYWGVVLYDLSGNPVVVGYNDMFSALGLSRAFSGSLWKLKSPVGGSAETYMMTYHIDESVYSLFSTQGMPETVYKYFSMVLVVDILKLNPALLGAEVTIPRPGEDYVRNPVPSDWGSALLVQIPGGRERFDVLGILDDKTLVVVEVKNMERVEDFYRFKKELLQVAARTSDLRDLLNDGDGPGVLATLISTFNGGRLGGGGKVASSFAATPYLKIIRKVERVKFVVVLADVDKAAVFVYDARLGDLESTSYLEQVAREVYYAYKEMPWDNPQRDADFYKSISDLVDGVVDAYSRYAPVVRLLR